MIGLVSRLGVSLNKHMYVYLVVKHDIFILDL